MFFISAFDPAKRARRYGARPGEAHRLTARRKRTGLTQAGLARRAGIRVETLNRVERGRTMPDFSTVRKLVVAMSEAEGKAHAEALAGEPDA